MGRFDDTTGGGKARARGTSIEDASDGAEAGRVGAGSSPEGNHLDYILTAYLFDNLSPEGLRKSEEHLAGCAACREELESLRRVRGLLEETLDEAPDATGRYAFHVSFDEHRRERILLAAARRRRSVIIGFTRHPGVRAAVLCLGIALVITMAIVVLNRGIESARAPAEVDEVALLEQDFSERGRVAGVSTDVNGVTDYGVRGEFAGEKKSGGVTFFAPAPQEAPPVTTGDPDLSISLRTKSPQSSSSAPRDGSFHSTAESATALHGVPRTPPPGEPPGGDTPPLRDTRSGDDYALSAGVVPPPPSAEPLGKGVGVPERWVERAGSGVAPAEAGGEELTRGSRTPSEYSSPSREAEPLPPRTRRSLATPSRRPGTFDEPDLDAPVSEEETELEVATAGKVVRHDRPGKSAAGRSLDRLAKRLEDEEAELPVLRQESERLEMAFRARGQEATRDTRGNKKEEVAAPGSLGGDIEIKEPHAGDAVNFDMAFEDIPRAVAAPPAGEPLDRAKDRGDVAGRYAWGNFQGFGDSGRPVERDGEALLVRETLLRGYSRYRALDPTLSLTRYLRNPLAVPPPRVGDEGLGEVEFRRRHGTNPFVDTSRDHLSTFALDVDTASYALARNRLGAGALPDPTSVRVEEFVNYFKQDYGSDPAEVFSVFCDGMPSVFGPSGVELLRVGIRARDLTPGERPQTVLTFAVDVSGSMAEAVEGVSHLETVIASLKVLVDELEPTDRVAIVSYASSARLVLPHTLARHGERIKDALATLASEGGTNFEAGLDLAYRIADENFSPRSRHRVMLVSDGVANIGSRDPEELLKKVRVFARRGIYLSVFGVGKRVNDRMLERLSNEANGSYYFFEKTADAVRLFREDLPAALQVLAEDAKIQVDFNPETVSHYRLLGYENRDIRDEDFRNDRVDAGEVGPGTTVTVLYEVRRRPASTGPLGEVYLRFRDTASRQVEERKYPIPQGILADRIEDAPFSLRHLAAVAETAELLRESYYARDGSFVWVLRYLESFAGAEKSHGAWQEIRALAAAAGVLTVRQLQTEIARHPVSGSEP